MTSNKGYTFLLRAILLVVGFLSLPAMADVPFSEVKDLPYQPFDDRHMYGEDPHQFAEYWQAKPGAPLVFLIHGGCWLNAFDLSHARPLASALAKRGLAVLSIEYRRVGDLGGGWPGTFDDISAAIENAKSLGHNNIFVAGHSAGGHLALWLAATHQIPEIKGVIGLAAISDLETYAEGTSSCEQATVKLLGGLPDAVPERYAFASPLLIKHYKPILLIHGDADSIVDIHQSEQFLERHGNVDIRILKAKGHFDMIDPRQEVPNLIDETIQRWLMP